jgi:hypothetical protein
MHALWRWRSCIDMKDLSVHAICHCAVEPRLKAVWQLGLKEMLYTVRPERRDCNVEIRCV